MILNDKNEIQNVNDEMKKNVVVKFFDITKFEKKYKNHFESITDYLR